jgi:glycosyltransferase involved in cell wall biosynthesis
MNDDQSLITSVIILQYNEKQYLEACLSSLLDQDIP